uniref:dioxygenase family protein n=1 Tax=Eubacterium cellulosolvens TaxID=29322 RepID=UPI0004819D2A|nr:class III extradiol ring-cleavage dioxygenase [[Eubacterium] cellulosolvens]
MTSNQRMPVIFTGHGSPLNIITENPAREGWKRIAEQLEKPKCIIAVSSHWRTEGFTGVRTAPKNRQVFDLYGYPKELYEITYEPPGDPAMAKEVLQCLGKEASEDNSWGIDPSIWSVLMNMYPEADVPVVMVSVNTAATNSQLCEIGRKLKGLRDQGTMILASGNIVHNLRVVNWQNPAGEAWADLFDQELTDAIRNGDFEVPLRPMFLPYAAKAIPTGEHYAPLVVALGAVDPKEMVTVFNEFRQYGSVSMTSYLWEV